MLDLDTYLVKEHVAWFKLTDLYDILDPASGRKVAVAVEEPPAWAKWLRLIVNKHFLPTELNLYASADGAAPEAGPRVLSIVKGFAFLRPKIAVHDAQGRELGYFQSKLLSLGGGFWVYRPDGVQLAEVKGDWKGWNFRFLDAQGAELGKVTKQWAGIGKELFTSADNYAIVLDPAATGDRAELRSLLLAAALAVDIVLKEAKG